MPEQLDFLKPSITQIRHQIRNILHSYNHDWDLIAELAQNSVDAISLRAQGKGRMELEINASERRIVLKDNGCGISPNDLPNLLAPFSSDKYGQQLLIGQKGVGVSFVIFSSSVFEIETHHEDGSAKASINDAWAWVESQNDELPKLIFDHLEPREARGTKVSVTLPKEVERDFFNLSFEQLEMVLRTRTAFGDTRTIWGERPNKEVLLTFVDLNGQSKTRKVECSYFLPTSNLSAGQYISLKGFKAWNTGERTDAQKRRKLRDKLIQVDDQRDQAGRTIRYWACFAPTRRVWDVVSVKSKLISKEILDLNPLARIERYGDAEYLFSGGMYTSTRGMPTGIRSDMRPKGSAGYLPNFFIIIDDPLLSFDIGRKSIPGRQLGMLRDIASDVFRDLLNSIKRYIGGEPELDTDDWDRTATFNDIRGMPDLHSQTTRFMKRPSGQEATIVAIFFELLGRGDLKEFQPYVSGYKNKYDLYSMYKRTDVVVEFKFALSSLFRDFDNENKLFDEVDIVVVWEVVEDDYDVVHNHGIDLEKIHEGLSETSDSMFHYRLVLGPTKPIKVMCLKDLVEKIID